MSLILLIILILVDTIVVSYLTEKEEPNPIFAIFFIAGSIVVYHYTLAKIPFDQVFNYAKENIWTLIVYVLAWIVSGVLWSFVRWYILLKDIKRRLDKYAIELKEKGFPLEERINLAKNRFHIPIAAYQKDRIISWMIYFPFSMLGVVCRNWVARLYSSIYDKVSGVYDNMTDSVFK